MEYSTNIPQKWFPNESGINIPKCVQETLALGDKFNLPYLKKSLPIEQIVIDAECLINQQKKTTK